MNGRCDAPPAPDLPVVQGLMWLANLLVVILPLRLGMADASPLLFCSYCLLFGTVLTLAEDGRFILMLVTRSDVRAYLMIRIGMTLVLGTGPFLVGKALA